MRIALKITLAITVWTLLVLVIHANMRLDRELRLIQTDMQRDQHLIGRALLPGVARGWQQGGIEAVRTLIQEASASEAEVGIRWVWLDGEAAPSDRPILPLDQLGGLTRAGTEVTRLWPEEDTAERLLTYVAVPTGARRGALELVEGLDPQVEFARRAKIELSINLAIIGAISALVAIALGWTLVGRRVRTLVSIARTVGAGGVPEHVRVRSRDELAQLGSEMNRMCDLLAEARDEAERRSAERDRALQQLRHADRLAMVGTLLSRVAHEIGTPLNVVSARAKMIARREVTGEKALANATVVAEQSDRIAATIRRMLDFARAADHAPAPVVDAGELAERTPGLLETIARDHGVRFEVASEPLRCRADPFQLQQILTNLAVNAIYASEPGKTVTIRVQRDHTDTTGRGLGSKGPWVRVDVEDQGRGIDPVDQARIFEPFFTTKPAGEGTGLGLAVARDIVRDLGGFIEVHSERGRGSTFSVYLPEDAA